MAAGATAEMEEVGAKNAEQRLEEAIAEIEKEIGAGAVQVGSSIVSVDSVSTGLLSVDLALGCGGLPRGRIIEVFGNESSGKTTFCLVCMAECQRRGGVAAFIDAEHAVDPVWAEDNGVDWSKVVFSQPDSGEQAMAIVETLVRHGAVDLIVIDSVAALVPQKELEGDITDKHVGLQARMMSQALRKLVGISSKSKTSIVFVNQLREKINIGGAPTFVKPEDTPGGRALKFYSSVRISIKRGEAQKTSESNIGVEAKLRIVKNKLAPPFKTAVFRIYYGDSKQKPYPILGVDRTHSAIAGAMAVKAIELRGSRYFFGKESWAGKVAATEAISGDPELFERVRNKALALLNPKAGPDDKDIDESALPSEND